MKITDGSTNMLFSEAVILNSTDAIASRVETDQVAIGYTSLGSVTPRVKALSVGGVAPTVANVQNGSYTISRPFVLAKTSAANPLADDFLRFVMSPAGQAIVSGRGLIPSPQAATEAYAPRSGLTGTLTLSGSTSVERVIERLREEYEKLNPGVRVEANYTGSGGGIRDAINGRSALAMSSRALNAAELEQLQATTFALDGIAVIVNRNNAVNNLTAEMITRIFKGEVRSWDGL
jgi:phosphate transport system substrate-binding protein